MPQSSDAKGLEVFGDQMNIANVSEDPGQRWLVWDQDVVVSQVWQVP